MNTQTRQTGWTYNPSNDAYSITNDQGTTYCVMAGNRTVVSCTYASQGKSVDEMLVYDSKTGKLERTCMRGSGSQVTSDQSPRLFRLALCKSLLETPGLSRKARALAQTALELDDLVA